MLGQVVPHPCCWERLQNIDVAAFKREIATDANRKWSTTSAGRKIASRPWEQEHPEHDRNYFRRELRPRLAELDSGTLARATGLAQTYCARILRGEVEPHPMHWGTIASAVGITPVV